MNINQFMNNPENFLGFEKVLSFQNEGLKQVFRGKIKIGFLLKIRSVIFGSIPVPILSECFEDDFFELSPERVVKYEHDPVDYSLCRMIVGFHRSNMLFKSNEERVAFEKDNAYQEELLIKLGEAIRLRKYCSVLFKRNTVSKGDEFIFFPSAYYCAVLSGYILGHKSTGNNECYVIFSKTISALSLLHDGFFDGAYVIVRSIIELFIKVSAARVSEESFSRFADFMICENNFSIYDEKLSDDFNFYFENRKNKRCTNKIEFLHFGWADSISDYHNYAGSNPYSIRGMMKYMSAKDKSFCNWNIIERSHKICNAYTHGSAFIGNRPIMHYFELIIILSTIIPIVYKWAVSELCIDPEIEQIDVLSRLSIEKDKIIEHYNNVNDNDLDIYYKNI